MKRGEEENKNKNQEGEETSKIPNIENKIR